MTTTLMILDGFGYNADASGNAIAAANTPNLDRIMDTCPHTLLGASGMSVGLPEGQMGNSEVGHMNIGAGRIIYQELTRITREIESGTFSANPVLNQVMDHVKKNQRPDATRESSGRCRSAALHIMGLLSDGGVHSHIRHLFALIDLAKEKGLSEVYVHCFLDGRDVPPRCAEEYLRQLEAHMEKTGVGKIASIAGRYYAMDRDNRWERIQKAYDALTDAAAPVLQAPSAQSALAEAYLRDENDEFVQPVRIAKDGVPAGLISDHDGVIMFNFRPDRARQITRAFCDPALTELSRPEAPSDLCYVCMTRYDDSIENALVAFPPQHHRNTLGEYIAACGLKQLRLAETEKYAHVTFFFNGGVEEPNEGEERILIPSPKVATYDLQPEMSAPAVCSTAVNAIESGKYDLIVMNFANPDMVGHTGVFAAAVAAVEAVDRCVGEILAAIQRTGGTLFLTADHGNADTMKDAEGNVITAHSTNPVPAVIVSQKGGHGDTLRLRREGVLADIAPTLLHLMGLSQPAEMTGKTLIL